MSSVSGQMGLFGQANYSSSKAGIIALTKVSAREFARQNITVNALAPGFIDVGMSKGMPEEVAQNFIKQIPLGRLGEAHEIVDAALFLASPMASYITGQVLNVNGGFYMGVSQASRGDAACPKAFRGHCSALSRPRGGRSIQFLHQQPD